MSWRPASTRAGDGATDDTADAATLGTRIQALLDPSSGLPLICTGTLPAADRGPGHRPGLAGDRRRRPPGGGPSGGAPDAPRRGRPRRPIRMRLWSVPSAQQRNRRRLRPGVADRRRRWAIALLDDWAETVPSRRHTTHAAFGFDAPRARAQQAVLLAVPPDERVPITAESLPAIVLSTRALGQGANGAAGRARRLGAWPVPTSMVLATGRAGSDLEETP